MKVSFRRRNTILRDDGCCWISLFNLRLWKNHTLALLIVYCCLGGSNILNDSRYIYFHVLSLHILVNIRMGNQWGRRNFMCCLHYSSEMVTSIQGNCRRNHYYFVEEYYLSTDFFAQCTCSFMILPCHKNQMYMSDIFPNYSQKLWFHHNRPETMLHGYISQVLVVSSIWCVKYNRV